MVRQTASTIFFEVIGTLILLVLVAAGLLAWRLSSGPLELSMFHDDIEKALTEARNGRGVEIDHVYLEWSPENRRVQVTADGLKLLDDDDLPAAAAGKAIIVMSAGSVIMREPEIISLSLEGGWIAVDRLSASEWRIAGETLPPIPAAKLPETPEAWLAWLDDLLPQMLSALKGSADQQSFEDVAFRDMQIIVLDAQRGEIMRLDGADARLSRLEGGLSLTVSGAGFGQGLPEGMGIDLTARDDFASLDAKFAIVGWPVAKLAQRLGVKDDGLQGLPSDIQITALATAADGLQSLNLEGSIGGGILPFGKQGVALEDMVLNANYNAADDRLQFEATTTGAGVVSGTFSGELSEALKGKGMQAFKWQSDAMRLDLTPRFEKAFDLNKVSMQGDLDLEQSRLKAESLTFSSGGVGFKFNGDIALLKDRQEGEPAFTGHLQAETSSDASKEDVLRFWPVALGEGARTYVLEKLEAGIVSNVKASLDMKRDTLAEGFVNDEALLVTFDVREAQVKFLPDLPAVENATGKGRLSGNAFRIDVSQATFGEWTINEGLVDFPALNPKGGDFRVFAQGAGPANDIMQTLANSRLKLNFDVSRISGDAEASYEMFRPSLKVIEPDQLRYSAHGTVRNAGLKDVMNDFSLEKATARVDLDMSGVTVTGFGDLGPAPVQFTWRDSFKDGDKPADLSASAVVTPDLLNRFGVLGRSYLSGSIPLEMQGKLSGEGLETADFSLDLDDSRIDISEIGWVKPAGEPGKASVQYQRGEGETYTATLLFDSEDANFDGDIVLGKSNKMHSAELRRAYLKDVADVSGTIRRGADDVISLSLTGPYIDLSGALPDIGSASTSAVEKGTPMTVDAEVERLRLRRGLDMKDARMAVISASDGIKTFRASGKADDGSALEASYDASGPAAPSFRITSDNAGFLTAAFLGTDVLEGGKLVLDGQLEPDRSATKLQISITDARLYNAPFLTQILSLASLQGLADTLGGDGVKFSRLDVPITISSGRYIIDGARASGPALGMTGKGFIAAKTGKIEFDGVLVPSFGLNSALGKVPIIGDLVVGRDGEGVFSLTYGVHGTLAKANVSVNPLSALAPGVIRRVFENPSDTSIPEAQPRPADKPIPSELEPLETEEF